MTTRMPPPDRDGRRDFDFLLGSWRVHNRRRARPLAGCEEWQEFEASLHARPILSGLGHLDEFWAPVLPDGGSLHGCALRLFDPALRSWSDWWSSSRQPGRLGPPIVGGFTDGRGTFHGADVLDGRPIRVRYEWTEIEASSARWEQAFTHHEGGTWETNWIMTLFRPRAA